MSGRNEVREVSRGYIMWPVDCGKSSGINSGMGSRWNFLSRSEPV